MAFFELDAKEFCERAFLSELQAALLKRFDELIDVALIWCADAAIVNAHHEDESTAAPQARIMLGLFQVKFFECFGEVTVPQQRCDFVTMEAFH